MPPCPPGMIYILLLIYTVSCFINIILVTDRSLGYAGWKRDIKLALVLLGPLTIILTILLLIFVVLGEAAMDFVSRFRK